MTVKELKKIFKKIEDDTEVLVGSQAIAKVERQFANRKMVLVIIPK